MTLLSILATIFGSGMALSNFPQALKIFKRKSARDISLLTYVLLFLGSVTWVLYGIEIKSYPLIIANSFGTIGVVLVVIGWSFYRK
ncbi:hypothetical protein GF386_04310 [Candidatus Pacearchaeota archaeon]|nr:hypothetical protein [Candidatus Pacearchaeota archaeon]MBD3283348.1 hypothetical protein [Candidatus Pacearchaeota archaeon]